MKAIGPVSGVNYTRPHAGLNAAIPFGSKTSLLNKAGDVVRNNAYHLGTQAFMNGLPLLAAFKGGILDLALAIKFKIIIDGFEVLMRSYANNRLPKIVKSLPEVIELTSLSPEYMCTNVFSWANKGLGKFNAFRQGR